MSADHRTGGEGMPDEARPWAPGDPERRRSNKSLLELTGTTAADHLPNDDGHGPGQPNEES